MVCKLGEKHLPRIYEKSGYSIANIATKRDLLTKESYGKE
jgi:hypothetical protein